MTNDAFCVKKTQTEKQVLLFAGFTYGHCKYKKKYNMNFLYFMYQRATLCTLQNHLDFLTVLLFAGFTYGHCRQQVHNVTLPPGAVK